MNDSQIQTLARIQKRIDELLDNNKKGKIILHIHENGKIIAEIVEEI